MYVVYPSRRYVRPAVTAFVEMTVQRLTPLVQPPFADPAHPVVRLQPENLLQQS